MDKEVLKNYRPISNLPFLGKVIERIVAMQLKHYLIENGLYTTNQSAYRPHHSTETAMLRVSNDINLALDNHQEIVLVMLDLSSAFDTIDHSILLERLETRFGLRNTALAWIASYLSNRTQSIVINHTKSGPSDLVYGVPQGSVLGPLLFSLYVAPIEEIICQHDLQSMIYADDTQMYLVARRTDQPSRVSKLELCAKDIIQWMTNNKLMCNSSKTEVIHFSSRYLHREPIEMVNINGTEIKTTSNVRDLGVTLDQCLTMSSHINTLCKSASYALKRIGNIRNYLDLPSTEKLIHAFITTKLDYCNSLLYGLPDKDISKLQRIQNSAARLVTKSRKFDHITPILRNLHWLPVRKRITYKILLITYKVLNGMAPEYLTDLLTLHKPNRVLRSNANDNLQLSRPKFRTKNYGCRAFSICAPMLWNDLPIHIRNAPSCDTFKERLKTFLFNS